MVHFAKQCKLLVDRFSTFLAKYRKLVEKMIHQKKKRSNLLSKIIKSRKSYGNGQMPYHCSFYCLARTVMHDVACKFPSTVRMCSEDAQKQ